jgi:hypothetical protein
MIGTIRKHQTWLWAVIVTLTIISFLWFFSPNTNKANAGRGSANFGSVGGQKLSQEQYIKARREVDLRYFFMAGGSWPGEDAKRNGFDPERETYQWLLLIQKEEQLGIRLSSDLVAQGARNMMQQFAKAGLTSPKMFVEQVLQPHGLDLDDFERYVRHYLGIQELISTVGMSGKLVTPQEAKALYIREHEELATEAVFFTGSNYLASITATPEAIGQFYTNRQANYRIPDQVQVNYVKFGVSNYLAAAEEELSKTNLSQIVDDNYQRLGTNHALIKDAKTPEEAKAKIREELFRGRALAEARKKAIEFARPLFDIAQPTLESMQTLAQTNGLTVQVSAPFDKEEGPKEFEVGTDFAKAAFSRTAEEPFAGPLIGKDGAYIIAINKRIPSRIPPLDEIRDRVVADYKYNQALTQARDAGLAFAKNVTNSLAQGKTFLQIATEANLKPIVLPPFSISTRNMPEIEDRVSLNQLKQIAFSTPPGKASDFQFLTEGGVVLYVKSKLPLDESKVTSELPGFISQVRQSRQTEAFNEWFKKEAEKGLRDTPLIRPAQQQAPATRSAKS